MAVLASAALVGPAAYAQVPPQPNPPLPGGSCGLRVALLVDASSSIFMAGAENPELVRDGATTLLRALRGTSSVASVVSFRNNAVTELPPTDLADATGFRRAVQAVDGIRFDEGTFGDPGAGTNWEAAFRAARLRGGATPGALDLVVILTDGNPNRYGLAVDRQASSGSVDFDPRALDAGVTEADELRRSGTRIVAVGVGDVRDASLRAVSGPDRGQDWFLGDFAAVAGAVGRVATEVCGARVLVEARVDGAPLVGVPFTLTTPGGDVVERRTAVDGTAAFAVAATAGRLRLTGRPDQGDAELASAMCTSNDRPLDAPVDLDAAAVVLDAPGTDVVACVFAYELALLAGGGPGAEKPTAAASVPECAGYSNEGAALTPLSTIRLYAGLRRSICEEALRSGISELLLAVTVQHEGYDRSKLVQGRFDKWIENQFTLPIPFVGKNDTVGIGQMRPDLALRLAQEYLDGYEDTGEDAIRRQLVYDTAFALRMAALYLAELQRDHDLSDRNTFITYAFGAERIVDLRRTDFEGPQAAPRGRRYDQLAREILARGENFE